jgi:hypothetical protein
MSVGDEHFGPYGKTIGAVAALFASILVSVLMKKIKNQTETDRRSGKSKGRGQHTLWRLRERQAISLARIKRLKSKGDLDKAISVLNGILREDPNCPAALFFKAQILLETVDNKPAASKLLKQVITHTSEAIDLNEQAVDLYKQLNPMDTFSGEFVHLVRKKSSI